MTSTEQFQVHDAAAASDWQECNALGLLQARASNWDDAADLFTRATAVIDSEGPDEARTVVLANLAAAQFNRGDFAAALHACTESLTLRRRLWGNDAIATARALSDLAAVHCALARHGDAQDALAEAIGIVQSEQGEESELLVPLIENAARAAIVAGDIAAAEPLVLRLHSLLDLHEYPTHAADDLFTIVVDARWAAEATMGAPAHVATAALESAAADAVEEEVADAVEAVATDAVGEEVADAVGEVDVDAVEEVATNAVEPTAPDFDVANSFTDLELVEPPPPTLDHVPENRRHVHRDDDALGFLVQHGTTVTPDVPVDVLDEPIGPLPELAPWTDAPVGTADPGVPAATAQTRGVLVRRTSREVPVVMPSPVHSQMAIADFTSASEAGTTRNALLVPTSSAPAKSSAAVGAPGPVLRDTQRVRASGGARVWLIVGGGLAAVAAAAGWYFA